MPAVLSGVAIAVLWFTLLNSDLGAVNQFLRSIGIEDPPNWFQDPDFALWGVAIMGLWGVGTNAIIYLAGLQNIPPDLYEAAGHGRRRPVAEVPPHHPAACSRRRCSSCSSAS